MMAGGGEGSMAGVAEQVAVVRLALLLSGCKVAGGGGGGGGDHGHCGRCSGGCTTAYGVTKHPSFHYFTLDR